MHCHAQIPLVLIRIRNLRPRHGHWITRRKSAIRIYDPKSLLFRESSLAQRVPAIAELPPVLRNVLRQRLQREVGGRIAEVQEERTASVFAAVLLQELNCVLGKRIGRIKARSGLLLLVVEIEG